MLARQIETAILLAMEPSSPTFKTVNQQPSTRPDLRWQKWPFLIMMHAGAWLALTLIGALTSWNDDLRAGFSPDFNEIFKDWARSTTALAAFAYLLTFSFQRWPQALANGKRIVLSYGILLLFLLPLQLLFVVKYLIAEHSGSVNLDAILNQVLVIDRYSCLLRLSSVTAVFFAVVIFKIWRQSQERDQAWAEQRTAILALRLELEEQKLLALRAQLEPHFVFNALNAISALVISDNKQIALHGIQGLSELLRYALAASEKNWVNFAEELAFVDDYLALQKLRYGPRLQIQIHGVNDKIRDADCLPLLLQPLIENALRHDLDSHHNASNIDVQFSHDDTHVKLRISNPLHQDASPNPGAGLGLRNIRARLQLAYGEQADLQACRLGEQFVVDLRIPFYLH